jgi:hypothetical protein
LSSISQTSCTHKETRRFRAIFVDGPMEAQERVTNSDHRQVTVTDRRDGTKHVYTLLLTYGEARPTLIYGLSPSVEAGLDRLIERYLENHQ